MVQKKLKELDIALLGMVSDNGSITGFNFTLGKLDAIDEITGINFAGYKIEASEITGFNICCAWIQSD